MMHSAKTTDILDHKPYNSSQYVKEANNKIPNKYTKIGKNW